MLLLTIKLTCKYAWLVKDIALTNVTLKHCILDTVSFFVGQNFYLITINLWVKLMQQVHKFSPVKFNTHVDLKPRYLYDIVCIFFTG